MNGSSAEPSGARSARRVSGLTTRDGASARRVRRPAAQRRQEARVGPLGAAGLVRRAAVGAMVLMVRAYQVTVSPLLGPCCRYTPSCSSYAIEALKVHGVARGLVLAAWRVLRCHPFAEGGYDPVPRPFRLFQRRGGMG
jgi:putative membrane protein insertion efficiency factor